MSSRNRTSIVSNPAVGDYFNLYYPGDGWMERTCYEHYNRDCTDTVGEWETANSLDLVINSTRVPLLDGEYWIGSPPVMYNAYRLCPISFNPSPMDPEVYYPPPSPTEKSNYAWDILSSTNPNVPHVSVPTVIGELKDLPSLVQDWGGSLLKKVAKGHLSWRWAIKPMISDIRKMCQFVDAVDNRLKQLKRLQTTGFLSGRCGLGEAFTFVPGTSQMYLESTVGYVLGYRDCTYTEKVWGTAQWILDPSFVLPKTIEGMTTLARRLTAGITSYELLSTAWELLPWSWFVDWFFGIGDVISAHNNTIPLTHTKVCLMRNVVSKTKYRLNTDFSPWIKVKGPYYEKRELKLRYVVEPVLPFTVATTAFIDEGKWSILGALVALKFSK